MKKNNKRTIIIKPAINIICPNKLDGYFIFYGLILSHSLKLTARRFD